MSELNEIQELNNKINELEKYKKDADGLISLLFKVVEKVIRDVKSSLKNLRDGE